SRRAVARKRRRAGPRLYRGGFLVDRAAALGRNSKPRCGTGARKMPVVATPAKKSNNRKLPLILERIGWAEAQPIQSRDAPSRSWTPASTGVVGPCWPSD